MPSFRQAFQGLILFALASSLMKGPALSQSTANAQKGQQSNTGKGAAPLTPLEKESQKHYVKAQEALRNKDLNTASEELLIASTLAPRNALIWYDLAVVESKQQHAKAALNHIRKAMSLGLPANEKGSAETLSAELQNRLEAVPAQGAGDGAAPGAVRDVPSYEDTVRYIHERIDTRLETQAKCMFQDHQTNPAGYPYVLNIDATKLSPHISWSRWSNDQLGGTLNCSGKAECIAVSRQSGFQYRDSSWVFTIRIDDRVKMEKALLHLLDLCGVPSEKPDLF